jgi:predicted dehydrogenase
MSFTWAGHGEPTGLPDGMVVYGSKGNLKGNTLIRDGKPPVATIDLFRAEATSDEQERWIPLGLTDTFAAGFLDFLRAVERGGQPEASGEEGLRDVATAFAILESSHARRAVSVEDVLNGRVRDAQRAIDAYHGLA